MPYSNDPSVWQNFYVMMGTANAALTGLVFVALSIHLREVLEHPRLRPRAVVALVILTTQIVISAIVLAPQPRELMGLEILVLNVIFVVLSVRTGVTIAISRPALISFAIRAAYSYAGISLLLGVGGGFYILAVVIVLTLGRTMVSCWALLTALE
jgi:hypothetical protein